MTKKIEETFNLPPMEDETDSESIGNSEEEETSKELVESRENGVLSKIDEDKHDKEADEVRTKAMSAFDDIMEVGRNVNPERSARLFEVAGQFLKTSLDAVNSKTEKQLKAAKLKIEAARLKINDEMVDQINSGREVIADRNELLRQFKEENQKNVVDAEAKEEDPEK